jgi:hypothetical protein
MIHIVFNESEVGLMNKVMDADETLRGEVVQIKDDFAVGPLAGIDTEEGWRARIEWWKTRLAGSPYGVNQAGSFDDRETLRQLIEKLDENPEEELWIWMAQNQHDVTGYIG